MPEKKRGPGRPRKLPEGKPTNVRCTLFNGELEKFNQACDICGMSQNDFSRAAVLHAADCVLGITPPTAKPKKKKT